jgi:SAM-dependent methyltransferase
MNYNQKRAQAMTRFRRGQPGEAARLFAEALAEKETSECWNDWATAQVTAGAAEEAEAGYLRALELDENNREVLVNLAVVRVSQSRFAEALALLRYAESRLAAPQRDAVRELITRCQQQMSSDHEATWLLNHSGSIAGQDEPAQPLHAHLNQDETILQLLPPATPGQRLLELGAGLSHLTSTLVNVKGYDVACADFGHEPSHSEPGISSQEHRIVVHTFDFESAPWPLEDESFDVVLGCEILERLVRDPVLVLEQINRTLKTNGLLLLTAANIASAASVARVLRGESPHIFGQYVRDGGAYDRHHREYTPAELERILACAGFGDLILRTHNFREGQQEDVLRRLLVWEMPISRRGEHILLLARKRDSVQERYPAEFYCAIDTPHRQPTQTMENLTCSAANPVPKPAPAALPTEPAPEKILVVHDRLPRIDNGGDDLWVTEFLRTLRGTGHPVTFFAREGAPGDNCPAALHALGIEVCTGDRSKLHTASSEPPLLDRPFEAILHDSQYDIVILIQGFRPGLSVPEQYLEEIRRALPHTRVIILTNDCHSRRERRRAELSGLLTDEERAAGFEQRERECYRAADLVIALNETDRQALQALDPALPVEVLSLPAADASEQAALREGEAAGWSHRRDVLLLADAGDPANREFQWFRTEIWPRVRRSVPAVKLHVVGSSLPEFTATAGGEGILGIGCVAELASILPRYRVVVSPVRFNTDTRPAMIKTLASSTPLVTTGIGAEGLQLVDDGNALVADSAVKFAAAVVKAYNQEECWQRLAANGRAHVEQAYSLPRARQQMEKVLQTLQTIPPGSMPENWVWSARSVERFEPRILSDHSLTAAQLAALRMQACAELAEHLLGQNQPAEACAQLRHIFAFLPSPLPRHPFFTNVLTLLERCYRQLGQAEQGVRCGREAILFLPEFNLKAAQAAGPAQKKQPVGSSPPQIDTGSPGQSSLADSMPVLVSRNGPRAEL